MEVIAYLKANGLQSLVDTFHIHANTHSKYPNLVQLKYSQIESPMGNRIVQECRGLILDQSKDWEVVARPYDKFFNFGEGHAAPLNWSTANVYEKLDGCFEANTPLNIWGGGTITIGEVVNGGADPVLIGMGDDGMLVPSRVTGRKNNGRKDHWLGVTLDSTRHLRSRHALSLLKITPNHQVYANNAWVTADQLKIGDRMVSSRPCPSESVIHLVKSSLLGDGSLSRNGRWSKFAESHCDAQLALTEHVRKWLGECKIADDERTSGFGSRMHRAVSGSYARFDELRREWYRTGRKEVPDDLDWMDDFSVAKWYMDDGSLAHHEEQQDRVCFATNSFSESSVRRLCGRLNQMYGVDAFAYESKGWCIRINAGRNSQIDAFWAAISPHVIPDLRYKLPERFREVEFRDYPNGKETNERVESLVTGIVPLDAGRSNFPSGRCGYDIETTTGNFMARNVLVHNSLMIVYFYNENWHVATSGTPDAGGIAHDSGVTFKDLFWKTWKHLNYDLPGIRTVTYMFELMTPENRVVVPHTKPRIVLHGARDLWNHREMRPSFFEHNNWEKVKTYPLTSIEQVTDAAAALNPMQTEGFVVADAQFNRVKVKSPQYVAIHHMRDGFGDRRMLELVRTNEGTEFLNYFPSYATLYEQMKTSFDKLVSDIESDFAKHKDIASQKAFALWATTTSYAGCLFSMRKKPGTTASQVLRDMPITSVEALIKRFRD